MPVINGTVDGDELFGTSDADEINGLEGDDIIDGGLGADTLNGGAGDDRFVFTQVSADPGVGSGLIDGGDGHDIIDLRAIAAVTVYSSANLEFNVGGQNFQFTGVEEIWFGDAGFSINFTGVQASLVIRSGTGGDTIYGSGGDDTVYAGGGSDHLWALGGADHLYGEAGNDYLYAWYQLTTNVVYSGGTGSDTLVIQSNWDQSTDLQSGVGYNSLFADNYTVVDIENIEVVATSQSTYTMYGTAGANRLGARQQGFNEAVIIADGRDGNDVLQGGIYDDILIGGAGVDTLNGGAGDDTLTGGLGADIINGGRGVDTAIFEGALADYVITQGAQYGELIVTLGAKSDVLTGINRLQFSDQTIDTHFDGLVLSGDADPDQLSGDEWDDTLSGLAGDDTLSGLEGDDTLDGGDGNDNLSGGAGRDIVNGDDGDDTILISRGGDQLNGGAGDDIFSEEPTYAQRYLTDDGTSLDGGDGIDSLYSYSIFSQVIDLASGVGQVFNDSNALVSTYSLANIENVLISSFGHQDFEIYGDEGDNALGALVRDYNYVFMHVEGRGGDDTLSGGYYNDALIGGDGDDLLIGGEAGDVLIGDAGSDTAGYASSNAAVTVNLTTGVATGGHAEGDSFTSIENLIGSGGDDFLTGDSGANVLEGGGGADTLDGAAGSDTASYRSSAEAVNIHLGSGVKSGGDAAGDIYVSIENLIGSAFNDTLTGDGGANTLDGGDGDDVLGGGNGDDILRGGLGADSLNGGSGIDVMDGGEGADNLQGGAGDDQLTGGLGDDILLGAAGSDTLSGSEGADNLQGGADSDSLSGGAGDDVLNGGDGADALSGSDGIDTASYAGAATGVALNLLTGVGTAGWAAGDTLFSIENVIGSGKADTINGSADHNRLDGAGGSDVLNGGDGDDTLIGGAGDDALHGGNGVDTLSGGTGEDVLNGAGGADVLNGGSENDSLNGGGDNDTLIGGTGDDSLVGGSGDDVLNGGADADTLSGGLGNDLFVFGGGWGQDQITDFSAGAGAGDVISFTTNLFADFAAVLARTTDDGLGNCVITRGGNTITLMGVTKAQLNADDFVFVPSGSRAGGTAEVLPLDPVDPLILPVGFEAKAGLGEDAPIVCPPGEESPAPVDPVVPDAEVSLSALAEHSFITRLLLTAYPERTEWTDWIT